jgi:hypothetical protein
MWNTAGREPAFVGSALSVPRLSLGPVPSRRTLRGGGWWPRSADPVAELPGLIRAIDDRRSLVTRLMLGPVAGTASRGGWVARAGRSRSTGFLVSLLAWSPPSATATAWTS